MRGPTNPSLNYEVGMLVEGFHSPPTFMMTYNKPYYGKLIEGYGFRKVEDMYAFWGHIDMISKLDKKLWFIANEAKERFNVTVRIMDRKNFRQRSRDVPAGLQRLAGGHLGLRADVGPAKSRCSARA